MDTKTNGNWRNLNIYIYIYIMLRTCCCLCNSDLKNIITLEKYPISFAMTNSNIYDFVSIHWYMRN